MDDQRADRCRYRPNRQLGRLDVDPVLVEKAANQQDGSDRDEDILAEEEGDVVDRCGVGPDAVADVLRQLAVFILGGAFCHRRDQRAHHLWMPTE